MRFTATGTTAEHSSSHVAKQKDPFAAHTLICGISRGSQGGEELLRLKRCLNLHRSEAEEVVAGPKAREATVVGKSAIRG